MSTEEGRDHSGWLWRACGKGQEQKWDQEAALAVIQAVVNLEMAEEKWLDPEWRQAEMTGSSEGWEQDRSQGKLQGSRPGRRDMW